LPKGGIGNEMVPRIDHRRRFGKERVCKKAKPALSSARMEDEIITYEIITS
jgi:hypothetical protein